MNIVLITLKRNVLIIFQYFFLLLIAAPAAMAEQAMSYSGNNSAPISRQAITSAQHALQENPLAAQGALSALQTNPALVESLMTAFKNNPQAIANLNHTLQTNPALHQQFKEVMQQVVTPVEQTNAMSKEKPSLKPAGQSNGNEIGPQSNPQLALSAEQENSTPASPSLPANSPYRGTAWDQSQVEEDAYKAAFRHVTNQAFPLKPEEIVTLHRLLDATQAAAATHPKPPPKPVSSSVIVNTAPGSSPPVIRLSKGYVSSLVFLDSSGAPWPIQVYDLGDPSAFNIAWDKKGNTLMVQAMQDYAYGNIAINLRGMNTPVTLTLVTGQPVVDYRVDLRVLGRGPLAQPEINSLEMPDQADSTLLNVLDGIPPQGSIQLTTEPHGVQAWGDKDIMYVRTQYNILSPAWLAKMSSADGTHAYKMQKTSTLLVAQHGNVTPIKIEGW